MPTALMAPPSAGGVAGRGLATVNVAGLVAVGRTRQASVPERPANDQCSTPVKPLTRSPPRKKSVPCVPTEKPPLARGWKTNWLPSGLVSGSFCTLSSSSRMTRRRLRLSRWAL